MMARITNSTRGKFIFALLICFFAIGIAPVFSQQILATAGLGWAKQFSHDYYESDGQLKAQANVLFVGASGFTVSTTLSRYFYFDGQNSQAGFGANFGLGYVYYNVIYLGGILGFGGGGNITPTLVAGYDFGNFILGAELQYYHDFLYPDVTYNGIEFFIGVGTNLGAGYYYQ